ncbi:MAG: hypothetical protein ACR2PM_18895, partial [Hyphomicrobiales bacterium]
PPGNTSAEGRFRSIAPRDAERVAGWVLAFIDEAVPLDPKPERKQLEETVMPEPYFLWECGGQPVSMAKIARTTRHCATISLEHRSFIWNHLMEPKQFIRLGAKRGAMWGIGQALQRRR